MQPDPPQEGEALEVTYIGPATEVEYQVDGGPSTKVTPDADGKFRIDPVPAGEEIVFSDNRGLPGYLHRCIVSLGR